MFSIKMSHERREFDNPFPEYDGKDTFVSEDGKVGNCFYTMSVRKEVYTFNEP